MSASVWIVLAGTIGLFFGSFVTLASYRLPRGESVIAPRSRCPACGHALGVADLAPVLSWLTARGRCRHCGAAVSRRYPVIELAQAALFAWVAWRVAPGAPAAILCLLSVCLLILTVTDLEHYLIPDSLHLWMAALALAYRALQGAEAVGMALGLGMFGYGLGLALHHGYRRLRGREGLGFGDVKLMGVAGLWLTPALVSPFLMLSGLCGIGIGLVWRTLGRGERFPFAPALAAALWLCLLYPETAAQTIQSLFIAD